MQDRRIGEILQRIVSLSDQDIENVLDFQSAHSLRFGEAAVRMNLVRNEDVAWALSKQLSYSFVSSPSSARLHPDLVMASAHRDRRAEAFRALRTHLAFSLYDRRRDATREPLAIVSAASGDGKSFIAANLAIAFAQLRHRTVLVDGDLRTPRLHALFDIDPEAGLSDALSSTSSSVQVQDLGSVVPNLFLLPCGTVPRDPTELLHSSSMDVLLSELTTKFDVVIVDTPAAEQGSDAQIIAEKCGNALLVVRRDRTHAGPVVALHRQLSSGICTVLGPLLNG